MSETSTSVSSWSSKLRPVEDEVPTESSGALDEGRIPIEGLSAPQGNKDSEIEEFPPENFHSELGKADLDQLQHQY